MGAERMCESIRKMVRAHISRSVRPLQYPMFDVFNRSYNTAPRNMELVAKVGSGKDGGFTICRGMGRSGGRCCKGGHERMRQTHIGASLVYPAMDVVPYITIKYTTASDSYSTLVTPTSHLNNMNGNWSKQPKFENTAYTCSRGRNKGTLASRLN